jgi:hypothetical protein
LDILLFGQRYIAEKGLNGEIAAIWAASPYASRAILAIDFSEYKTNRPGEELC